MEVHRFSIILNDWLAFFFFYFSQIDPRKLKLQETSPVVEKITSAPAATTTTTAWMCHSKQPQHYHQLHAQTCPGWMKHPNASHRHQQRWKLINETKSRRIPAGLLCQLGAKVSREAGEEGQPRGVGVEEEGET